MVMAEHMPLSTLEVTDAGRLYRELVTVLVSAGIPDAAFEAGCMLEQVFHMPWHQYRYKASGVTAAQQSAIVAMAKRRITGEPLQYILGEWEFYGMRFLVGSGVLIPRPDTECLISYILEQIPALPEACRQHLHLLDLCTGSGCIALTLKQYLPSAVVAGVDVSPQALAYAEKNRQLHGLDVPFLCGDATSAAYRADFFRNTGWTSGVDILVSNPPYLTDAEMQHLQRELHSEPASALAGGSDGLDFYRHITAVWADALNPGGRLVYEIGEQQGAAVSGILRQYGFQDIVVGKDMADRDRIVSGIRA